MGAASSQRLGTPQRLGAPQWLPSSSVLPSGSALPSGSVPPQPPRAGPAGPGHLRAGGPGERAGRWAGPLGPRGPDLRPELSSAQQCVSQTKGKSAPQPGDRGPTGPRGQSRTGARRLAAGRSMGSSDPAHPPRSAPREPGATPGRPGAPPLVVPFPCRSHTQTERWGDPPGTRFFTSQT